jgi:hypothetical protein
MSKYLKLPSLQGASSFGDSSILDFEIPADSYYNLANSYLSFMVGATTTETDPNTGDNGVHFIVPSQAQKYPLRNNCFIGDYRLSADRIGVIDDVLNSNIMNANFDALGREFEEMTSDNYKQLVPFSDVKRDNLSYPYAWARIYSNYAQNPFEMKIPLNSISSFCNTPVYPAMSAGKTHLKVQLKTANVIPQENTLYPDSLASPYTCNDLAAASNNVVLTTVYGPHVPIAAGDAVVLTYTVTASGAFTVAQRVVTAVATDAGTGVTTVTVDGAQIAISTAVTLYKCANLFNGVVAMNDSVVPNPAGLMPVNFFVSAGNKSFIDAKKLIGKRVLLRGTGMRDGADAAINTLESTLVDVVPNDPIGQPDSVADRVLRYRLADPVYKNAAALTAITLYILDSELPALRFADLPVPAPAADTDITQLTISATTLAELNIWVGMKANITGWETGANTDIDGKAIITALTQNGADVVVTFDRAVFTLHTTRTAVGLALKSVPAASIDWSFSNPNLVVQQLSANHRLVAKLPKSMTMNYPRFTIETTNIPTGTLNFNKIFSVDPSVKNLFVLVVDPTTGLISALNNPGDAVILASYRWRINNIDKTTRDIVMQSSLEKDTIIQTMNNSSKPLKNLQKFYGLSGTNPIYLSVPMCAVPYGIPKQVQLALQYSAATPNDRILYLVKEGISSITL